MNEHGLGWPSGLRGARGEGVESLPHYGLKRQNQPERAAGSPRPRCRVLKSWDTGSLRGLRSGGQGRVEEPSPPPRPAASPPGRLGHLVHVLSLCKCFHRGKNALLPCGGCGSSSVLGLWILTTHEGSWGLWGDGGTSPSCLQPPNLSRALSWGPPLGSLDVPTLLPPNASRTPRQDSHLSGKADFKPAATCQVDGPWFFGWETWSPVGQTTVSSSG